jgi:hypothetical protein
MHVCPCHVSERRMSRGAKMIASYVVAHNVLLYEQPVGGHVPNSCHAI